MVVPGRNSRFIICVFLIYVFISRCTTKTDKDKDSKETRDESWKKKKIQDYSEADMERLFDQWEDNDEDELEEDELPEWKREPPKIDMSKIDPNNPEQTLKMSKKGRTLMMFATVSGEPNEKETEKITSLWHSSLFNAHIETQRYVVGSNRVIFMLTDGSKAWDVKDFLVRQERCEEVTIEGKSYPGAAATKKNSNSSQNKGKMKTSSERDENIIHKKVQKDKNSARVEDNRSSPKKEEL